MTDNYTIELNILQILLLSEQDRYKRFMANRQSINSKAQANFAIAGVFIAAIFSWFKNNLLCISNKSFNSYFVLLSVILFLFSVFSSVIVLFVGKYHIPNDNKIIRFALSDREKIYESYLPMYHDLCDQWAAVADKMEGKNNTKVMWLFMAQISLAFGVLVMALIIIIPILHLST